VIPAFKAPFKYELSPLTGKVQVERDTLAFFKGDVGVHRNDEVRCAAAAAAVTAAGVATGAVADAAAGACVPR
jgi:hypothetical protein